ncbi:hypothetical protein NDU88_004138 [Pleurodeles waltl]|uniref:Uncharacterized protein n=1 Tax=Pleurodeles waltl TaxID=8319 RepID=A0AAV7QDY7_PLEWA|nr:hypothetical protein NDU88_004138 [Pleurodeles waltl]
MNASGREESDRVGFLPQRGQGSVVSALVPSQSLPHSGAESLVMSASRHEESGRGGLLPQRGQGSIVPALIPSQSVLRSRAESGSERLQVRRKRQGWLPAAKRMEGKGIDLTTLTTLKINELKSFCKERKILSGVSAKKEDLEKAVKAWKEAWKAQFL